MDTVSKSEKTEKGWRGRVDIKNGDNDEQERFLQLNKTRENNNKITSQEIVLKERNYRVRRRKRVDLPTTVRLKWGIGSEIYTN